ncbi:hypothetical protein [Haloechinothrix salitolerans]|uniref:Uncharacterized protein n=1 Tax=Haloechinothrix salitolerans TaxID=926830 RepID=A0ABW2C932_9PSEU
MEQFPLVMGVASDSAQAGRVLRDGADIVDLGRASGALLRELRHTHAGVPLAVDVAGVSDAAARVRELAGAGADLVYATGGSMERELAVLAAESGAAVVCSPGEVEWLRAEGVARVFVTPGWRQSASARTLRWGRELADGDWPVLLTVSDGDAENGPDTIAAAALAAMAGVRVLRTDRVTETRRTVDMIASIAGTRQPARVRRALA